jgi:murein tripeptide amidase MpaA
VRALILWLVVAGAVLNLAGVQTAAGQTVRYDGERVVRVMVHSSEQHAQLLSMTDDVWSEGATTGPIDVRMNPEQFAELQASGLKFVVLIDDLQTAIEEERTPAGRGQFDQYWNLTDTIAYLNTLVALRPDLAQIFTAGTSLEGRAIQGIKITAPGPTKSGVLVHGTQHAREWIGNQVVVWTADKLIRQYDTDPYIRSLVDNLEWYLIPVLNVDGYTYTWTTDRMWRKNRHQDPGTGCYGVDLNRNWGMGWGGPGASGDPCSEEYYGTGPFSELETQAMRNWILSHGNIMAYADLHSYSQTIFYPYSYGDFWPPEPDRTDYQYTVQHMAQMVQAVHGLSYTYGRGYDVVYQVSGGSRDWVYGVAGRYAIGTELRDTGTYGFTLPASQIIPQCEEYVPALMWYADHMATPQRVLSPNGGETLAGGTTTTITWSTHGGTPTSVDIYLSEDSGVTFPYTLATGEASDGSYSWFISQPASTHCRVKVAVHRSDLTIGEDVSDADFTIGGGPQLVYSFPLDTNPGWTTEGQWAWGDPTGSGGDPHVGYTGNNVYGYNLAGQYTNNMPRYYLTTTSLNLSNVTGAQLRFRRWLGVQSATYDHAGIEISTNGTTWTSIWEHSGASINDASWTLQAYDISAAADNQSTVYIRWAMGTTNNSVTYCGWNIDDIEVWGVVTQPQWALGDVNCDGAVNTFDIDPFVMALTDPTTYAATFSGCDINNADANGDGLVNAFDIDPFVLLLTGGD